MDGQPEYLSRVLESAESLILFVPEPSPQVRVRILLALAPLFAVLLLAITFVDFDKEEPKGRLLLILSLGGAAALFVHWLRLCRTSFAITTARAIRFVSGRKADDLMFKECQRPSLISLSDTRSAILRCYARLCRVKPAVRLNRLKPLPMTSGRFLSSRDLGGMSIGMLGVDMSANHVFEDTIRAWEAAQ
jgi:hypothetical protein